MNNLFLLCKTKKLLFSFLDLIIFVNQTLDTIDQILCWHVTVLISFPTNSFCIFFYSYLSGMFRMTLTFFCWLIQCISKSRRMLIEFSLICYWSSYLINMSLCLGTPYNFQSDFIYFFFFSYDVFFSFPQFVICAKSNGCQYHKIEVM